MDVSTGAVKPASDRFRQPATLARVVAGAALLVLGMGCAAVPDRGYWGASAGWPDGARLAESAVRAARSPHTWIPAAGALVFGVTDLDDEVSEWATDHTPVFGSDAEDASDTLRSIATAGYLVTALTVPSDSLWNRTRGLLIGGSTFLVEQTLVDGLKQITDRERPDGSNDRSFPSGHTSRATTAATMAVGNLAYADMPHWVRFTAEAGLYGTAAATGWARVEAGRHYPSDILAGYAIGSFLARFAYHAFLESGAAPSVSLEVTPLPGGGLVHVTVPLH